MRVAALGLFFLGGSAEETKVWVFFTPDSPAAARIFTQLRELKMRVRPVLLTERYIGNRRPGSQFLATLRVSGEVRVVDGEGLREAKRLGIREVPAVAVTRGGRTHVACGNGVDIREILRCLR